MKKKNIFLEFRSHYLRSHLINANKLLIMVAFFLGSLQASAQYTAVPDANFEAALTAYDDIANDGQVPFANISLVTILDVSNQNISDLTGIEDFQALQSLNCSDNSLTSLDLSSNTDLTFVNAKGNSLTFFDGTNLSNLLELVLFENNLTTLDLSDMLALEEIDIYSNQITSLDFTQNTVIKKLFIDTNNLRSIDLRNGNNTNITDIDLSNNPNLTCVLVDDVDYSNVNWNTSNVNTFFSAQYCEYTAIPDAAFEAYVETLITDDISGDGQVPTELIEVVTSIQFSTINIADLTGIEDFTGLEDLNISGGTFTTIDLTNNTLLENLLVTNTNITNLNLSANNQLQTVGISGNVNLETINLNNGANPSISSISVSGNTSLTCIIVDDIDDATNNWTNVQSVTYSNINCGYVSIPDASFEAALESLGYDDISGDGLVPLSLIENVTTLNVSSQNIADLTGIQHFTALTELFASSNDLTTMDLSANVNLIEINSSRNDLATIDVSMLPNLEILDVSSNNLTSLDITINTSLTQLLSDSNNLTSLDISGLVNLESLFCHSNSNLSSIVVTGVTNLENLWAYNCSLSSIDVSSMPNLAQLRISNNNLNEIDLSNNASLETVLVENNNLTSFDLRNGNNQNITSLDAEGNSNLTCVSVDDIVYAIEEYNVDSQVVFTTDCDIYTYIADTNFETALGFFGYDDIPNDHQVPTNIVATLQSLDVSNSNINDLNGIEDFISLVTLDVSNNNLLSIDLSNNTLLTTLHIQNNELGVLNLSTLPNLTSIDVSSNQLFSLNIRNNNNNNFTGFNAMNNADLTCILVDDVNYSITNFTNIDAQMSFSDADCTVYTAIPDGNFEGVLFDLGYDDIDGDGQVPKDLIYEITSLEIYNRNISDLTGIEDFALLEKLDCYNNSITTIDLSQNNNLRNLNISNNELTVLDVSANLGLEEVACYGNDLNSINITGLINLIRLESYSNQFTSLDVSSNIALEYLDFGNNDFTTINVSNNTNLIELRGYNNSALTTVDLSNNILLENINLNRCQFYDIDLSVNTNLKELDISGNALNNIDLSANTLIEELDVEDNKLSTIDLSANTALVDVDMGENVFNSLHFPNNNNLTNINVKQNPFLTTVTFGSLPSIEEIIADDCIISSIDVSHLSNLQKLDIRDNQLMYLDLSNNTALTSIIVNRNQLTYLNVQNGNNSNVTTLLATGNDDLTCIVVDDIDHSTNNWTSIDIGVTFSTTTCGYVQVPDLVFENELESQGYDDIADDGQIPVALIENVTYLNVANKNISDATGLEGFKALDDLYIHNNNLTSLDIVRNNALKYLFCNSNNLESLDITTNTLLEVVNVSNNGLTSIDLSNNTLLNAFYISNNPMGRIDVSKNTLLNEFHASGTDLVFVDLTANTALQEVELENTPMVFLNLKNGNNTNISDVVLSNNPNLSCVAVDDVSYAMANWPDVDDFSAFTTTECMVTAYTAIPDVYFEERLYNLGYDDILGDAQVPTVFIQSITSLDLSQSSITDITGIEDFTSLEVLRINSTGIDDLDLSGNTTIKELYAHHAINGTLDLSNMTALEYLACYETGLNNLILTGATALKELQVYRTGFTDLDISTNTALEKLVCYEGALVNLNTTGATSLKEVYVYNGPVKDLDFSTNIALERVDAYQSSLESINTDGATALKELYIQRTSITDVDVTSNAGLTTLHCYDNSITTLDVSTLSLLEDLNASGNSIATLDLSANPNLSDINVGFNSLVSLDIRNGNNINITSFNAILNNDLACIKVDGITYAEQNFTNIDTGVLFTTESCGYTLIPDVNFEAALAFADDVPGDGQVPTAKLEVLNIVNIDGEAISDLTGIEDFTSLEELRCGSNNLTSLDLSNNTNLTSLNATDNDLTTIDISKNTKLESLTINRNNLTSVDVSNNILLENLVIGGNTNISALDVSQNTLLSFLDASNCSLTSIDLSNNPALLEIYIDENDLTGIDLSNNPLLEDLYISFNPITSLNLSNLSNLDEFYAEGCDLEELNIKNGGNSNISYFDTTNNPNLTCVLVDNVSDVNGNWYYDLQTTFNEVSCDTTNPTAICQNITIQLDSTGNVSMTPQDIDNGSTDNGTIVSWEIDIDTFDCTKIGANTVTLTVTDAGGNSDSCTATVIVEDTIDPVFETATLPNDVDVTFNNGADDAYILENVTLGVVFSDNCDSNTKSVTISQNPIAGTELAQGDHLITITATDNQGNEAIHTFTITVSPILTIEDNMIQGLSVYPNPTQNGLNVNIEVTQVTLYNIKGQKVMETKDNKMDISHFESGVYFMHITTQQGSTVKRIIKY
ncbi:T9SS type A sorting domain-containing protein [Aquimarina sp. 2201CG5-10]|uniref:T9SS type A sorting domain-containing protein n=1 Tax=Aquimarina callyspongiae TaxID=3098150 RepID=UPI002AB35A27|nr:T9SS type A sorting domain-containing protein [Aquimarina sp. 2201CG5-10]MDY8138019.1 T9SS type A sorting domain-containing protein [Aquimarina sp. 2201CG5-10]